MKKLLAAAAVLIFSTALAAAQFPNSRPDGAEMPNASTKSDKNGPGPAAIGKIMAQVDPRTGNVAIVQAPDDKPSGGGLIHLSAFGWLEPYADTLVQLLITVGIAWFGKSKYSAMLDESSRAALETYLKNRASSLIAAGAVSVENKSVRVDNALLFRAVAEASERIPDAMKRFNLTPQVLASKIIDHIPQVAAGAQIVAQAHAPDAAPLVIMSPPSGQASGGGVSSAGGSVPPTVAQS